MDLLPVLKIGALNGWILMLYPLIRYAIPLFVGKPALERSPEKPGLMLEVSLKLMVGSVERDYSLPSVSGEMAHSSEQRIMKDRVSRITR